MKRTFAWKLSNGQEAVLTAEYEEIMAHEELYADGDIIKGALKPTIIKSNLEISINGKVLDRCSNHNYWSLMDTQDKTAKKIRGMKVGFADAKTAAEYEKFIAGVIAEGKSDEVKEYEAQKETRVKAIAAETEKANERINKLLEEKGLTYAEALQKMRTARINYNNLHNEGGDGYIPNKYYDIEKFLMSL